MSASNPDDLLLLIRCPSCGQRFKVGEDLRGRTVECGGCEHHFRINDEVIVRGKKFYPGERSKDPALNRFQRVPLAIATPGPSVQAVRYANAPDPANFEPAPPLRILAGAAGVCLMVLMALLLILGANRGAALDGMTTTNRLMMAGFTALLGVALLLYANRRSRGKALMIGLVMAASLISLPFFFTKGSQPLDQAARPARIGPDDAPSNPPAPEAGPLDELRTRIGTRPLELEIERLRKDGSPKQAVGIWLRNLRETNRILVRDFLLRSLQAAPESHPYPRSGGDYLMVVTGIDKSLDEVAKIASALGELGQIYPELAVVEVRVNNDSFIEGPIEKLNNKDDPAFYELNRRELESIDLERVSKAVRRLADAEPKVYRSDITRLLLSLLVADWVDFKGDVCRALAVWSDKPGKASAAALSELRKLMAADGVVPVDLVALIVKEKNTEVIPELGRLWSGKPTQWESLLAELGPAVEPSLVQRFPSTQGALRHSAVRILGKVGGKDSLPLLEAAAAGADAELRVLIDQALASIQSRTGP